MLERISVGFDNSPASRSALSWAVGEATLHNARLTAWTVLGRHPAAAAEVTQPVAARSAERSLREAAGEIAGAVAADHLIAHGAPAAELVRASGEADLLVVGSRGHGALAGLLLGSVTRTCLHSSRCPVAVVPGATGPDRPHRRIVVGVDGSAGARRALAFAAGEARVHAATLVAVYTTHWDRVGHGWVQPTTHELLSWGHHLLDQELADAALDVPVRPYVVHGHPADVLVRHARNADLLVLGSRGHTALADLTLGSVSDHCARHAPCPMVVTPVPARHGGDPGRAGEPGPPGQG